MKPVGASCTSFKQCQSLCCSDGSSTPACASTSGSGTCTCSSAITTITTRTGEDGAKAHDGIPEACQATLLQRPAQRNDDLLELMRILDTQKDNVTTATATATASGTKPDDLASLLETSSESKAKAGVGWTCW